MAKGEKPSINYELCVACGICVQSCPLSCLDLCHFEEGALYRNALPYLTREDQCTGCGICAKYCTINVIELK